MKNLSTNELSKLIELNRFQHKRTIAYLPIGCMEQHGPFLPLETDCLIAENITMDVSAKLGEKYGGYTLPAIIYTPSKSNTGYCGTVSIKDDIFRKYAKEVCSAIFDSPFDALVIVCGHAGAESSMREVGYWIVNEQYDAGIKCVRPVLVTSLFEAASLIEAKYSQKPGRHADWREFLLLYHLLDDSFFDRKRIDAMKTFERTHSFTLDSSRIYGIPMQLRSVEGVLGNPLPTSDDDWGKLASDLWTFHVDFLAKQISDELDSFWQSRKTAAY